MKKELAMLKSPKMDLKLKSKRGMVQEFLPKNAKPSNLVSKNMDETRTFAQYLTPMTVSTVAVSIGTYLSMLGRDGFNDPNFGWDALIWGVSLPAILVLGIVTGTSWRELGKNWDFTYRFYASNHFDGYYNHTERKFGEDGGSQTVYRKGSPYHSSYRNGRDAADVEGYTKTLEIKAPSKWSFLDPTSLFRPKKISHYVSYNSSDGKYTEQICYVHGFQTKKVTKTYESEMSLFDSALEKVKFIHSSKA